MRPCSTCTWSRKTRFAAAGVWHPDNSALTKIRTAIVAEPEQWAKVRRKLELGGRQPEAATARIRPKSPVHRGHQAEGLRGIGRAHRGAGVWPQVHARFRCGVPDDAAAGRVHDEGAGVGALGGGRWSEARIVAAPFSSSRSRHLNSAGCADSGARPSQPSAGKS